MEINPFVGAWRLVSYQDVDEAGNVTYPFGEDAQGILIYSADGYMCAAIMNAHRPAFASTNIFETTAEERAAAGFQYVSYAGPYEIIEGKIRHHVEIDLIPNAIGTVNERTYTFAGDELTLALSTLRDGAMRRAWLVWRRVQPNHHRGCQTSQE